MACHQIEIAEESTLFLSGATQVSLVETESGTELPFDGKSIVLGLGVFELCYVGFCGAVDAKHAVVPTGAGLAPEALAEVLACLEELKEYQSMQIEFDLVPVGCTTDEGGEMTGKVLYQKNTSEADGVSTESVLWIGVGSSTPVTYDVAVHGEWGECPVSSACDPVGSQGLLTDLSNLWN